MMAGKALTPGAAQSQGAGGVGGNEGAALGASGSEGAALGTAAKELLGTGGALAAEVNAASARVATREREENENIATRKMSALPGGQVKEGGRRLGRKVDELVGRDEASFYMPTRTVCGQGSCDGFITGKAAFHT